MRLDQYLVNQSLVKSRSQAKECIKNSLVLVNAQVVNKASYWVGDQDRVELLESDFGAYVSRAGHKLQGAVDQLQIDVRGLRFLDIGLSTGGFSDFLLQRGASFGVGIDVGHSQLDASLQNHPKLVSFEGVNAKNLSKYPEVLQQLREIDLVVMDVSFISITKIFSQLQTFRTKKTKLLSLVKPQFELDRSSLNKQGIVKEERDYIIVEERIRNGLQENQWNPLAYIASSLEGGDGNKEFFVYAE